MRRSRVLVPLLGLGLLATGGGIMSVAAVAAEPVSRGVIAAQDVGHGSASVPRGRRPMTISIPDIDVVAQVVPLVRESSGELHGPDNYDAVGWWSESAGLGVDAPVVLLGHVDNHRLPKVFKHLRDLRPGAVITLGTGAGSSVRYSVDAVRQYAKDAFPTEQVYGTTGRPTLRLMTCGGYSWLRGHRYRDNVVVFGHALG